MARNRQVKAFPGDVLVLNQRVGQGRRSIQAGELVRVVAFEPTAYGRTGNHGLRPGLYHNPRWLVVENAAAVRLAVNDAHLDPPRGKGPGFVDAEALRTADLPATPFWETDTVSGPDGERLTLARIDYLALDRDPSVRAYACERDGARVELAAADLALVERGPVWRRAHGEAIAFPDLDAEAAFHRLVGETDEVRNPGTGLYRFDRESAAQALADGLAHGPRGGQLPEGDATVSLVLYRDAGLGERVRLDALDSLGAAASPAP